MAVSAPQTCTRSASPAWAMASSGLQHLLALPPLPAAQRCVSNTGRALKPAVFEAARRDLLAAYLHRTPSAVRAIQLLSDRGARVHNDHVALRSFVDSERRSGLAFLRRIFVAFGYEPQQPIVIPGMPVNACWLEPPNETQWPKVFISELRTDELPPDAAATVYKYIDGYYHEVTVDAALQANEPAAVVELLESTPWDVTSADEAALRDLGAARPELASATEYAAWTLSHGHRWNHATILVNTLAMDNVGSLRELNSLLCAEGFQFNTAGGSDGYTQGSKEVHLEQSSTVADLVPKRFACGTSRMVRCSFLELIERHDGFRAFLGQNAKGIFQSTWATSDQSAVAA